MKIKSEEFEADITIFESDGSAASWPSVTLSKSGVTVYCESKLLHGEELMIAFNDSTESENIDVNVEILKNDFYYLKFLSPMKQEAIQSILQECHGKSQTASAMEDFEAAKKSFLKNRTDK